MLLCCSRQQHFEPNTVHVKINVSPCAYVQKSKFSTMTLLCLHNMARLSHGLDKLRRTDDASPMAANFASGVGPCMGIVEPFKHVLRVTAHLQILALGL